MTVTFTAAEDASIIDARASGLSWVKVALSIHRNPGDVRRHVSGALGLAVYPPAPALSTVRRNVLERQRRAKIRIVFGPVDGRWPLHAGHPVSWGAICTAAYPPYVSWAR